MCSSVLCAVQGGSGSASVGRFPVGRRASAQTASCRMSCACCGLTFAFMRVELRQYHRYCFSLGRFLHLVLLQKSPGSEDYLSVHL